MNDDLIHWTIGASSLTLFPSRGRVLQAAVAEKEAFWTNPEGLAQPHPGGDRAWTGPEVDWFWKCRGHADLEQYTVPEGLDPGTWKVDEISDHFCRLRQECDLSHLHREAHLRIEMTRSFQATNLPDTTLFSDCMAFQTENEIRILEGTMGQPVDFWSILQVPAGGRMVIPCRTSSSFQNYLTPITAGHWTRADRKFQFAITGQHQYKIGLAPDIVTGRMAYVRPVNQRFMVVFRQFAPTPWRRYCDVPPTGIGGAGDAVQIYNDGGEFGGFGEMEYHTAALVAGQTNNLLQDTNLTIIGLVELENIDAWTNHWMN